MQLITLNPANVARLPKVIGHQVCKCWYYDSKDPSLWRNLDLSQFPPLLYPDQRQQLSTPLPYDDQTNRLYHDKFKLLCRMIKTKGIISQKRKVSGSKVDKLYTEWNINKGNFVILLPGRITNWKGHIFTSLKEGEEVINAVIWKDKLVQLEIEPKEGEEVICSGRISTGKKSQHQLVIDKIAYEGDLHEFKNFFKL